MKHILFALLIFSLAPLFVAPAQADIGIDNAYLAMVDSVQQTPDTADWAALRKAYTKTSFYAATRGVDQATAPRIALQKLQAENTPQAQAAFQQAIRQHYADVDTLLYILSNEAKQKTGAVDTAALSKALKGLLDAILATGDGKTMQTAFKTISHDEENAIAQGVFRLQLVARHVESGHGRIYSTLTVREAQGPEMEMFFDITDRWALPANPKHAEKPAPYSLPQTPDAATDADNAYMKMVSAAQASPDAVNWDDLRKAYAATSFYAQTGPLGATALAARMAQHDANRGTPESQDGFKKVYLQHFAVIGVQKMAENLQSCGLAKYLDAKTIKAAQTGLLNSVLKTGDGKTVATAFQIITGTEIEETVPVLLENPVSSGVAFEAEKVISRFKGKDRKTGADTELIFAMQGGLPVMMKSAHGGSGRVATKDRSEADARYLALADAAIKTPGMVDYAALRSAYAQTSFYSPYGGAALTGKLDAALTAALEAPAQVKSYEDLSRAHLGHFAAHLHALHAAQSKKPAFIDGAAHQKHLDGIRQSILKSGDGKTPQTAYHVIDIQEEYMLMKEVLKIQGKKRPTLQQDGHVFDVFDYTAADGSAATVYFNVDMIFARDPTE